MARAPAQDLLPCPGVELGPAFARRLEQLLLRIEAARERREGSGRAGLSGGGEEFVGYRPYRPGEDLRQLDWDLYARLDQPYVRTTRREAAEHWAVVLDTSASMGVGPPGKLQHAAEVAAALASLGLRQGARVQVVTVAAGGTTRSLSLRASSDLGSLLGFLEELRAGGGDGIAAALPRALPSEAGRAFVLGDLLDLDPRDLARLATRRRELVLGQTLAPVELVPPGSGTVEWICPETGERARVELGPEVVARYSRELELRIEALAGAAARHGARHALLRSDRDFEDGVRELLP